MQNPNVISCSTLKNIFPISNKLKYHFLITQKRQKKFRRYIFPREKSRRVKFDILQHLLLPMQALKSFLHFFCHDKTYFFFFFITTSLRNARRRYARDVKHRTRTWKTFTSFLFFLQHINISAWLCERGCMYLCFTYVCVI